MISLIRLTRPQEIEPYLQDASQFSGQADGVFLPENEREVAEFLKDAHEKKIPVTISSGRTGLAGAAVPLGGWVLSTEKLSRILEVKKDPKGLNGSARVESGLLLKNLNQALEKDSLFYPPDPTGPKALIGGTLATNASGPNSFKYGATRRYLRKIRVVFSDGEILDLRRGQILADPKGILQIPLARKKLNFQIPPYPWPRIKHAGGYFAAPGMDAIDLFIGSEGTLGVITEMEVELLPKPHQVLAFVVFFRSEEDSWRFAKQVRESKTDLQARALEYFDSGSLDFLRPGFSNLPKESRACLFVEQETEPEKNKLLLEKWHQFFERGKALRDLWFADSPEKQEAFRKFRSELPLAVRDFLREHRQVKIGTDTCVPHEKFEELMLFHRKRVQASGFQSVTFGHIGESHVHLNLLPRTAEEQEKGRALYPELVRKAMELGGTFSAEHGVGKLKRPYLSQFFGEKAIQEMAALKRVFDPHLILSPGNLFEL